MHIFQIISIYFFNLAFVESDYGQFIVLVLVVMVMTLPGDLEDPQQAQGAKHTDSERCALLEVGPYHLEYTAHYNLSTKPTLY